MKYILTLLLFGMIPLSPEQVAIAQDVPNGDFETWVMASGIERPDNGWTISDEAGLGCNPYSSVKTNDKATGNYAILLESNNCINFGGIHEGYADINFSTTARPDSLKFKYKSLRGTADSAMVEAWVYNYTTPIGHTRYFIDHNQGSYKEIAIPFNYSSSALSTTAIDIFISSDEGWGGPTIGNKLWIDDLHLVTIPNATRNYKNNIAHLSFFPVPASNSIDVSFSVFNSTYITIRLQNISGQTLLASSSYCPAGKNIIAMDISSLPTGVYICELQFKDGERAMGKIIKQ